MTKRHRMESWKAPATLEEQSPSLDGILEHLKAAKIPVASKAFLLTETWQASVAPRKFGQYPGACPMAPVFLKVGSRK